MANGKEEGGPPPLVVNTTVNSVAEGGSALSIHVEPGGLVNVTHQTPGGGGTGSAVQAKHILLPGSRGGAPLVAPTPSQLLLAANELVDYVDSFGALEELGKWYSGDDPFAIMLVSGAGGAGKTRLLVQWLSSLGAGVPSGAGFFDVAHLSTMEPIHAIQFLAQIPNAVIVIDYAETCPVLLQMLLSCSVCAASDLGSLRRVVLLARHEGGWWKEVSSQGDEYLDGACERARHFHLPSLSEQQRAVHFENAWRCFAEKLGLVTTSKCQIPILSDARFGAVLYVHMAALLQLSGKEADAPKVLKSFLDHELGVVGARIRHSFKSETALATGRRWVRATLGAIAVRRGIGRDVFLGDQLALYWKPRRLRKGVARALGVSERYLLTIGWDAGVAGKAVENVAKSMADIYAVASGEGHLMVAPLSPDILGEALIQSLIEDPEFGTEWLVWAALGGGPAEDVSVVQSLLDVALSAKGLMGEYSASEQVYSALHSLLTGSTSVPKPRFKALRRWLVPLITALQSVSESEVSDGDSVASRSAKLVKTELEHLHVESPDLARKVALRVRRVLPAHSIMLGEIAALVAKYILELPDSLIDEQGGRASLLEEASDRYSNLKHKVDALDFAENAVQIRRALAAAEPKNLELRARLANSLSRRGKRNAEDGRWAAAKSDTAEALVLFKSIPSLMSSREARVALAEALNGLGIRLEKAKDRQGALEASLECAQIYESLYKESPSVYAPGFAKVLNNVAFRYSKLNDLTLALEYTERSVEIRRALVERSSDAYLPALAISLGGLAARLSKASAGGDTKLLDRAKVCMERVIEIRRKLYSRDGRGYIEGLAVSLHTYGKILARGGSLVAAVAQLEESLSLKRECYSRSASRHSDSLVLTLKTLGGVLSGLGLSAKAADSFSEAATVMLVGDTGDLFNNVNEFASVVTSLCKDCSSVCPRGRSAQSILENAIQRVQAHMTENKVAQSAELDTLNQLALNLKCSKASFAEPPPPS